MFEELPNEYDNNYNSEYIQWQYKNGIKHGKMCRANNKKCKTINDEIVPNKREIKMFGGNIQIFGNVRCRQNQANGDKNIYIYVEFKEEYLRRTRQLIQTT